MVDKKLYSAFSKLHFTNGLPLIKRTFDNESIILFNNDIFQLAGNNDVIQAQTILLQSYKDVILSATVHSSNTSYINTLESRFSMHLNCEETILCQSGYIANICLLQALIENSKTHVFIDEDAHISLFDGLLIKNANIHIFAHNNIQNLEKLLKEFESGLIIVDSVYSTDGSICPLPEIIELKNKYHCKIIVDESHAIGIYGPLGEGKVVEFNLQDHVEFRTASLSKAFAGRAGLITCSSEMKQFIRHSSSSMVCSTSLLPLDAISLETTLNLMPFLTEERRYLFKIKEKIRGDLKTNNVLIKGTEHLICFEFDSFEKTINFSNWLESNNIFGALYFPPAMPANRSMVRLTLNSTLSESTVSKISQCVVEYHTT